MIIHRPLFNELIGILILMVNTMIHMLRNRILVRYHNNAYCGKVL
jgi:hypothetical protein